MKTIKLDHPFVKIVTNFTLLSINQGLNFIVQLITVPYLVKTVGLTHFGSISFCQATCYFISVIADYGFIYSSTRQISIHRDKNKIISEIFSNTINTKFLLAIGASLVSLLLFKLILKLETNFELLVFSLPLVLGQVLIPTWFFQGMESLKRFTLFNSLSKALALFLIFAFVKQESDFVYVNLIQGGISSVFGASCIVIVIIKYHLCLSFKLNGILTALRESWHFFVSNLATNILVSSSLLILGFVSNAKSLGVYSVVDKIYNILRMVLSTLFNVVYPRVCDISVKSKDDLFKFLKYYNRISVAGMILASILIFIFSDYIIFMFTGGAQVEEASRILKLVCFIPIVTLIGSPLYLIILSQNLKEVYLKSTLISCIVSLCLTTVLSLLYQGMGLAISMLTMEIFIVILYHYFLSKTQFKNELRKIYRNK